jgi:hypothetical protein
MSASNVALGPVASAARRAAVGFARPADVTASTGIIGAEARRWFALAIGSLVIAGLLSLSVVIGRLPVIAGWIGDPLFFKRCLVVHVDLALVVWFYAFLAALNALRVGRACGPIGLAAFFV